MPKKEPTDEELLTWTDHMRAGFHGSAGQRDPVTGEVYIPADRFLEEQKKIRRKEYEDEQKRIAASKKK